MLVSPIAIDIFASLFLSSSSHCDHMTNAGYVSWRDTQAGSWYVEILDRILEENATTDDLGTMLMMVSFSYHVSKFAESDAESLTI